MKKRFYFPFVALSLGMIAAMPACSDDDNDKKGDDDGKKEPTEEVVTKPEAKLFFNEFVADGGTLRVKGAGFSNSTVVEFEGKDGVLTGTDVKAVSANELTVTVPAGVKESSKVTFKNPETGESSTCAILLRDTRNVLVDFDSEVSLARTANTGGMYKDEAGVFGFSAAADVPNNYSTTGKNQYSVLNNVEDWQSISYAPAKYDDEVTMAEASVFGSLLEEAKKDPTKFTVKFEVCAPKAVKGLGIGLSFIAADDATQDFCRKYSACLQMSEIDWNKEDTVNGWTVNSVKDFTSKEWMTVSVPMSEFVWNLSEMSYLTGAANIANGWEISDAIASMYADVEGHKSYAEANADKFSKESLIYKNWGGLVLFINPYDFSGLDNTGAIYIDNIRVVPNDGNGTIFPKAGFGVPSQSF